MKLILLAVSLLIISCNSESTQSDIDIASMIKNDTLIIKSSIKEGNRIYYYDDFGGINYLNSSDNIFILDKEYFQIIDGKFKIVYILKKGEKIEIAENGLYSELILNTDTTRSNELLFPLKYFKKFDSSSIRLWTFQKSFVDKKYTFNTKFRDLKLFQEYSNSKNFLKEYQNKYKLSEEFYDINHETIKYRILEKLLMAVNKNFNFPKTYVDSIAASSISELRNDKFLFLRSYRNCTYTLLDYLKSSQPSKSYIDIINDNFKDQTKEFLLASVIVNARKTQSTYDISEMELQELIGYFFKNRQVDEYHVYVKQMMILDSIDLRNDELINLKKEKIKLSEINDGKITYLDFWASWCGPCRAEMPNSKELSEKYTKKGVNFVYISTDENAAAWERASKQIGIPDVNSYLLPNSKKSAIGKQFNLSTIPRYVLIDKFGKVINADAPRPSDTKIIELLDKLLEK